MLHRTTTTIAGVGIAAAAAVGAIAVTSSHGTSHAGSAASSGDIRTTSAAVGSKTETILTNAQGMPLYYYAADGPKQSFVSGQLAALWPADTSSATPKTSGLAGTVTVVHDAHGNQVAYNGHLLYTFVSDHRGVVTGQGVENFFVATPTLSSGSGSPATGTSSNNGTSNNGTSNGNSMYGGAY